MNRRDGYSAHFTYDTIRNHKKIVSRSARQGNLIHIICIRKVEDRRVRPRRSNPFVWGMPAMHRPPTLKQRLVLLHRLTHHFPSHPTRPIKTNCGGGWVELSICQISRPLLKSPVYFVVVAFTAVRAASGGPWLSRCLGASRRVSCCQRGGSDPTLMTGSHKE